MKGVTEAKGLRNLKTATTKRIHTKPPQRGTAHLDMYLLGKERQRLEQELANLDERRARIQDHLVGIAEELAELQQVAQKEEADERADGNGSKTMDIPPQPPPVQSQQPWRTMPLEY